MMVLNQKTSPSGHSCRPQKNESIRTVTPESTTYSIMILGYRSIQDFRRGVLAQITQNGENSQLWMNNKGACQRPDRQRSQQVCWAGLLFEAVTPPPPRDAARHVTNIFESTVVSCGVHTNRAVATEANDEECSMFHLQFCLRALRAAHTVTKNGKFFIICTVLLHHVCTPSLPLLFPFVACRCYVS